MCVELVATAMCVPAGTVTPLDKVKSLMILRLIITASSKLVKLTFNKKKVSVLTSSNSHPLGLFDEAVHFAHVDSRDFGPAFRCNDRLDFLAERGNILWVRAKVVQDMSKSLDGY